MILLMTKDRGTGLIALVLGAVIAVMTSQLPPSTIQGDIGPSVFPYFSAGLLMICGAGLLVTGNKKEASIFDKRALKRLAIIFGSVLLYCVVMNYVGFLLPTAVILFALSTMFAEGEKVAWWKRLIYSIIVTMVIYLLFHNVLNLKLPTNQLF